LPGNLQDALVQVQERSREGVADVATQRQRLDNQLTNLRTLFELGDVSRDEYLTRREELTRRQNSLRDADEWEGILAQAAVFLSDLPAAWRAADDSQRNALARMLFVQIRIKDDWVAARRPQPNFAPFFQWDCQVRCLSGGSDGDRSRNSGNLTAICGSPTRPSAVQWAVLAAPRRLGSRAASWTLSK
jgi:hypothetical protein